MKEREAFQILLQKAKQNFENHRDILKGDILNRVEAPTTILQFHGFSASAASTILTKLERKGLIEKIYWAKGNGKGIASVRILKEEFPASSVKIKSQKKIKPQKTKPSSIPNSLKQTFRKVTQEREKEAQQKGKKNEEKVAQSLEQLQKSDKIQRWWRSISFSPTDTKKKIDFCVVFPSQVEIKFQVKSSEYGAKKHQKISSIPVIVVNRRTTFNELEKKIFELKGWK